jgi:hypothetical protein
MTYFPFTTICLLSVLISILPLCVCVCVSLTHTYNSLSSSGISYHIHRVCLPKAHAVVPVMDIPKYLIFLHIWEECCLILVWWFAPPPPCFSCVERLFNHGPVLCSQGTGAFSPEFVWQDIWNHFAKGSQNNEFAASVSIPFCPIFTTTLHMKQSCWTRKSNPSFFSFLHIWDPNLSFLFVLFFTNIQEPQSFFFFLASLIFYTLRTQTLVSFLSCMS